MIIVFDKKFVSEIRELDDASQIIDMYARRKGFSECSIINTANKVIGTLKNEDITWLMEPNPDFKYSMIALDGTIISDNVKFIEAKHAIVEIS